MAAPVPTLPSLPDVGGIFSGIANFFGDGMVGVIIAIQLPLWIAWLGFTAFLIYVFVLQRMTIMFPWNYKFMVTKIVPYANMKMGVFQDKGGFCSEGGMIRFKMKSEGLTLQKPDSADIFDNGECIIISLSKSKKFYAQREIDYANHKIIFNIGDPTISQVHFFDGLERNDADWLVKTADKTIVMILLYAVITIMLFVSNVLVMMPLLIKAIFR